MPPKVLISRQWLKVCIDVVADLLVMLMHVMRCTLAMLQNNIHVSWTMALELFVKQTPCTANARSPKTL